MASTSLETLWTAKGTTYTLPGFGLVATTTYTGMGSNQIEFAPGKAADFAKDMFARTSDVGKETADYMALVVACEITRDARYTV